jgi:uncharacterized protein YhdP
MRRHRRYFFLLVLIPILVVGVLGYLFFHYFLHPDLYKKIIEESLTRELQREVVIGDAKISLWGGIGITFDDFRIRDRSLTFDLLRSKRLMLRIKIFPLLKGEVKWKQIILDQPTVHLSRDRRGRFNMFDGPLTSKRLQTSQQKMIQTLLTLFGGSLALRNGKISFLDQSLGPTPLTTEIKSLQLQLSEVSHQKSFPFRLSGEISHSNKEGLFSIAGTIFDIPEDMDLSKGKVNAKVEIKGIETLHFWPYLKTFLPMETISGNLDLNAHYQGTIRGPFKASAKIKVKEFLFDYPKVFATTLRPAWMNMDLMVDYDLKNLRVHQISIELPEVSVTARGKIYGIGSEGMGMEAEAQSGPFDLSEGKKFIPFQIITPDVSQPLFQAEGSGPVQILSVKLSGKMSEIEHCDLLPYAHTLSVEMKANGARLKLPWDLPPLEDVKGRLSFKDGNLHFNEVEGRVFHSVIDRANGTFHQLLLASTLEIRSEGRIDLNDLPSLMEGERFSEDLSPLFSQIQSLSGRADYNLFAKVVLKSPLRFQHQGSYHLWKVRFIHRQIPFPVFIEEGKLELSHEELRWSEAKVEFGGSSFLVNGSLKRGKRGNSFEISARGRGELKNLFSFSQSPLFPAEIRTKTEWIEDLSGTAALSFKWQSQTGPQPSTYEYEGEVTSKGVHLRPKGLRSPIIFKEGSVSFSNVGVNLSKIKVLSDTSSLSLDGQIREGKVNLSAWGSVNLKHLYVLLQSPLSPRLIQSRMEGIQELTGDARIHLKLLGRMEEGLALVKEGEIQLKGISLKHQKIPVPLSHIEGSLFLSSDKIRFDRLKGAIGTSPLTLSGALSWKTPEKGDENPFATSSRFFSFEISSPQLDLDPIFPKQEGPTSSLPAILKSLLSQWSFDGKVEVGEIKFRGLPYRELKTELKTVDGKLFLSPFQLKGFGGDLWGEEWIEPTEKGIRFEIKPRLSNLDATLLLRTLLHKGEEEKVAFTGRVDFDKVELRGEGEDFQKIKESLNGRLRLEMENGVIEKGNILAKIFSILNVSQLFWGRLPDLKTNGLPYRSIIATLVVKEGVASTEDLVVESDAMRITLVGSIDVGKNLIDARIGIHPLVTVDMVLSHLPIAGYILTGKDKAFLSYIYSVKGDLDDPEIESIPIKGLGENFWGIVQRLLETPIRPFQKNSSPNH